MAIRDPLPRKLTYEDYLLSTSGRSSVWALSSSPSSKRAPTARSSSRRLTWSSRKTARVYRRDGGRFVALPLLSAVAGEALETPLVPGLVIPLAKIFR